MVRPFRPLARMLAPVALVLVVLAGCGGENPYEAARNAEESTTAPSATTATDDGSVGDNAFLPDRDIGDCVGLLEKPDCGSKEKGGTGTYLTFAVLIAGLGVIFWRIAKSIRQRDAVVNAGVDAAAGVPSGDTPGAGSAPAGGDDHPDA